MEKYKVVHATLWDDEEVPSLLHIWGDERIQQDLDGCTRKRPAFEKMAKRLAEKGFERSHVQILEKIKQLKQRYKKVQDNNNRSGNQRKTCPFCKELDSILGHRPITKPINLLESLDQEETENEPKDESDEDSEDFIPVPVSLSSPSTIDSLEPDSQAADIPTMVDDIEGRQVCVHHFPL